MTNPRLDFIDIMKGLGIFLVVWGHCSHVGWFRNDVLYYLMPMFFFVSGFLYKNGLDFKEKVKRLTKSILIPYFIFFTLTFFYWLVIERNIRGAEYPIWFEALGLIYANYTSGSLNFNGALWFLPCLFILQILFFPIAKYCKSHIDKFAVLIPIYLIGWMLMSNGYEYMPWNIERACVEILMFGIGYMCKNLPTLLMRTKLFYRILLILSCVILRLLQSNGFIGEAPLYSILYYVQMFATILIFMNIGLYLSNNKLLKWLGKNSLIIFGFQEQGYRVLLFVSSKTTGLEIEAIRGNLLYTFIISCITVMCLVPLCLAWNTWINPMIKKSNSGCISY